MNDGDEGVRVVDDPSTGRYVMTIDDVEVGFVEYKLQPPQIELSYIEVDPPLRDHGLGARLAAAVLDDCRSRALKVTPRCPYIADYIEANPVYADLLA